MHIAQLRVRATNISTYNPNTHIIYYIYMHDHCLSRKLKNIFCSSRPYDNKYCFSSRCTICPRFCDNSDCQLQVLRCVYKIKCNICQEVYIGETSRTAHERFMEHDTNRYAVNPGKYPDEALSQHYKYPDEALSQHYKYPDEALSQHYKYPDEALSQHYKYPDEALSQHYKYPDEALSQHYNTFHPGTSPDLVFSILDKELSAVKRKIKEAFYISNEKPSINNKCWSLKAPFSRLYLAKLKVVVQLKSQQ